MRTLFVSLIALALAALAATPAEANPFVGRAVGRGFAARSRVVIRNRTFVNRRAVGVNVRRGFGFNGFGFNNVFVNSGFGFNRFAFAGYGHVFGANFFAVPAFAHVGCVAPALVAPAVVPAVDPCPTPAVIAAPAVTTYVAPAVAVPPYAGCGNVTFGFHAGFFGRGFHIGY